MSRTRRFLGGAAVSYGSIALVTLVGLWLTRFLLGRIGERDYGLWLIGAQVLLYLALLDLGVVALLPRETAYAGERAAGADGPGAGETVGRVAWLVLAQTPLVAAAAVALLALMPGEWAPLRAPLGLVMAVAVVLFPLRVYQAALQGLQDLAFLGMAQTGSWLAGTAVTVILVVEGYGLMALAAGAALLQVLSAAACAVRFRSRFPTLLPWRLGRPTRAFAREYLGRSFWVSVAQVAQILLAGTDLIVIGKILGESQVVTFACTGKLIALSANLVNVIAELARPGLSQMKVAEPKARTLEVVKALGLAVMIASGALVCTILAVNEGFVGLWVGDGRYGGLRLTALMLASMLLRHYQTSVIYGIFALGHERRISLAVLADGLVTVAATVGLVRLLGPEGAPLGSLIGVAFVGLPLTLSALAREGGVSAASLVASFAPWLGRFAVVGVAAGVVARIAGPRDALGVGIAGVTALALYGTLMAPLLIRPPLGAYVRPVLDAFRARLSPAPAPSGGPTTPGRDE